MLFNLWRFLNDNAGVFQAIFAFAIVIATIIYVVINSLMHKEMVKTREREEKPIISIRIKREEAAIYSLIIENISNVPAYNLKFIKSPDLKHTDTKITTKELGIIKYPINYMAPKQSYDTVFLNLNTLENKYQWIEIEFELIYDDSGGNHYNLPFKINVSALHNTLILQKKDVQ